MLNDSNNPENTGSSRDEKGHFLKGVSGNPYGKPKGAISVVAKIKEKLLEIPEGQTTEVKRNYLELLVSKYFKQAIIDGDTRLITDLIDRVDGKALQRINAEITDIDNELDKLEKTNYDEVARQAKKQMVEVDESLQSQE